MSQTDERELPSPYPRRSPSRVDRNDDQNHPLLMKKGSNVITGWEISKPITTGKTEQTTHGRRTYFSTIIHGVNLRVFFDKNVGISMVKGGGMRLLDDALANLIVNIEKHIKAITIRFSPSSIEVELSS